MLICQTLSSSLSTSNLSILESTIFIKCRPTNFEHKIHLEVDLNSPMGIKGLTNDMMKIFKKNDLSENEVKKNPNAMIQILNGLETK